jgi:TonB-linked SusC/RagA family outer membrane protein
MKKNSTHYVGKLGLVVAACCLTLTGSPVEASPGWNAGGQQLEAASTKAFLPDAISAGHKYAVSVNVVAQVVQGRVTDTSGEGIPGVAVMLKGTSTGATTDLQGNFRVSIPDEAANAANKVLVFSFVGYVTQEVEVGNQTEINVTLQEDTKQLDEVVVVGYGVQKKATVTGSVASVKGEELQKSPALNVSNAIAGRMPGVIATNGGGEPGYDGSAIRIRGSNTLGNNDALIVIDGIPARQGGFERLNPADIENISVLKDASAAIYGARAANGVILITTKRGTAGKPKFSYSINQGWAQPTVTPRMANAAQFAELRNELDVFDLPADQWANASTAFREEGSYTRPDGSIVNAPFSPEDMQLFQNGSDPWHHPNTDWYGETLKTWSPQSRHNVQLTGGTEDFKYLASLGYQNQDAYYKNSATGYKQYDLRINLDANINEYISTSIGMMGRNESRFFPTQSAGAIFRMLMRGIPTEPAYWPNGDPGPDIENGQNPVVITTNATGYDRDERNYLQSNGSIDISNPWVEGLTFTGTASVDKMMRNTKRWETPWYLYTLQGEFEEDGVTPRPVAGHRGPAEPRLSQGNEDQLNILLGGRFSYERKFGEDHDLTLLAGVTRETVQFSNFGAYRRYFISSTVDQMFAGGDPEKNNYGGAWERARLNYYGRVAYNYKEKYLTEFLWRYDGSYNFAPDSRYGFFPGVMLGWRLSEENFWKNNITFMDNVKLRGSWGQMGNDQIYYNNQLQEYQYLSTMGFGSYIIGNQMVKTLYETRVPNPDVTWEVANNSNIGLEGQMFNGKIFFELDAFLNKRTNILWRKNASIPQTTGMSLPAENIGEVENKGWEFNVGYNGQAGEFSYNVSVNGGYAKNKILFWDESPGAPEWQRSTGMPMDTYVVYQYDGVFRDQAEIDANTLDYSDIVNTLRPGDMKFVDFDGDGRITPDDRVRTDKNHLPTFQGGMNIGIQYKNFDLSILFQASAGAQVWLSANESGRIGNFLADIYENRWTPENPSSEHPRITDRANQYYSGGNTYWLRSTDYIRLKNFELGYTLPASVGSRAGISNLRLYVNGLNLATWDKYGIFDPEVTESRGQYYPQARVLNTGLTITF